MNNRKRARPDKSAGRRISTLRATRSEFSIQPEDARADYQSSGFLPDRIGLPELSTTGRDRAARGRRLARIEGAASTCPSRNRPAAPAGKTRRRILSRASPAQNRRATRSGGRASAKSIPPREIRLQAFPRAPRPRPRLRYEWDARRITTWPRTPRFFLRSRTQAFLATKYKAAKSRPHAGGD